MISNQKRLNLMPDGRARGNEDAGHEPISQHAEQGERSYRFPQKNRSGTPGCNSRSIMEKCKDAGIPATGDAMGAKKVANTGNSGPHGTGNYNSEAKVAQVDSKAAGKVSDYNSERSGR